MNTMSLHLLHLTLRISHEYANVTSNMKPEGFYLSWEGCMKGVSKGKKKVVKWVVPPLGSCKFNVDGEARGKPDPAGIGGVLHDDRGRMLTAFSESVGSMESNETELWAIWFGFMSGNLVIEGDSTNAIAWANNRIFSP